MYLLLKIGWGDVGEVLSQMPAGHSKINPYDTGYVADFNFKYFLIGVLGMFYGAMSWQGTQAYNSSARTAHEGKMGQVMGLWRIRAQEVFMAVVPILVFTVMHHSDWTQFAAGVSDALGGIGNEAVRNQMRGPIVLARLLPPGLIGCFAALMLGAFISTHNTYLHSWSSIFVQDVVLPLRRKPLSQRTHLRLLRGGVVGVAVFIFLFSLFYKQSQAILLFFALTGAIFAGWSGAVIIGGLYTRWGTTLAAWATTIVGVVLALGGFVLEQSQRSFRETGTAFWGLVDWMGPERALGGAAWVEANLPNGQELWGWAMWLCLVTYVAVSGAQQLIRRTSFDLDRLLHRGKWRLAGEVEDGTVHAGRGWKALGITSEFGRRDKALYLLTWGWNAAWVVVFLAATVYFPDARRSGRRLVAVEPDVAAVLAHAHLDRDRRLGGQSWCGSRGAGSAICDGCCGIWTRGSGTRRMTGSWPRPIPPPIRNLRGAPDRKRIGRACYRRSSSNFSRNLLSFGLITARQ